MQQVEQIHTVADNPSSAMSATGLEGDLLRTKTALEDWWHKFETGSFNNDRNNINHWLFTESYSTSSHPTLSYSEDDHITLPTRTYRNDYIAELTSKHAMSMLLLLSMLSHFSNTPAHRNALKTQCAVHGAAILSTSVWIDEEDARGNNSGTWHILLPLAVVSMASPSAAQRRYADRVLGRYGHEKAVGGVVTLNKLQERDIFGVK